MEISLLLNNKNICVHHFLVICVEKPINIHGCPSFKYGFIDLQPRKQTEYA